MVLTRVLNAGELDESRKPQKVPGNFLDVSHDNLAMSFYLQPTAHLPWTIINLG